MSEGRQTGEAGEEPTPVPAMPETAQEALDYLLANSMAAEEHYTETAAERKSWDAVDREAERLIVEAIESPETNVPNPDTSS